jgi:hypothetical protein
MVESSVGLPQIDKKTMNKKVSRRMFVAAAAALAYLGIRLEGHLFAQSPESAKVEAGAGVMAIVAYRPRSGKAARLLELTKEHVPMLRRERLATDRPAYAMLAADGTIIEVFEWKSQAAIDSAHTNPAVGKMWGEYAEVCEFVPLAKVKECSDMFAGFQPIALS